MPTQPLGPTGLLAQSMTLPAGSQSMAMGGMGLRAQGMDGRKKAATQLEYLLIGGGGGAGIANTGAGGGGAGEYLEGIISLPVGSYAVTIGTGGALGLAGNNGIGSNGDPSTFAGLTARGGGGGGGADYSATTVNGLSGGSGGGGGSFGTGSDGIGGLNVGANTFPGASGSGQTGVYRAGGGGGGAGGPGTPGTSGGGGSGGAGKTSSITGSPVTRAGGGRGGVVFVAAGSNGAGAGPNTGSGGDGENSTNGADGVFIIRYLTGTANCTGGTVTTSGGYTIHTFTSSGTFTVA